MIIDFSCANIVPPQGGFRDSLPPVLVRSTPAKSAVNVTGKKFSFVFDEYVTVDNFQQNVIVSPVPKTIPAYISRLNTVTITLKDSLEPNTTYTIDFGDAIKDVNEGNIMRHFTYTFSTGPLIDSLSFRGNVIIAESGEIDSTLTVMLHKSSEDSAVYKERPRYITKLDKNGNFVFHNLPSGTFYVYALKDDSRNYLYRDRRNLFAFADSPVIVEPNTTRKTLYAYQAEKGTGNNVATTSGKPNVVTRRLTFQSSAGPRTAQDLLQKFSLTFDRPLRNFDSSKVHLTIDSTYTPVTGYSWTLDSTRKKVTLNYNWSENTNYHLVLPKDFATDTLGQKLLKADTISFKTMSSSDYGKLAIRLRNIDFSKKPVLQFVTNGEVAYSYPLTDPNFSRPMFVPGEYELRILYDKNGNGVWDPGQFYGIHHQPEIVKPLKRKISIRANYDNQFEI